MKMTLKEAVQISQMTLMTLAAVALSGCGTGNSHSGTSSRLQNENTPLKIDPPDGAASIESSAIHARSLSIYAPTLSLVATVAPPTVNGVTLQADSAMVTLTSAYVSYNLAGTASGGGVDVINITTPILPILGASRQFTTLDVNGVYYRSGSIYIMGNDSVQDDPARLQKFDSNLFSTATTPSADLALPGYAALSVVPQASGAHLYTVTGDNSGLQVLNSSDLSTAARVSITDARDVGVSAAGDVYVVTGGNPGYVNKYNSLGVPDATHPSVSIGNTGAAQSKSTISIGSTYAIASAGSGGVKLVCLANMAVVGSALPAAGGVTNASVFAGGLIFTADGDAGVTVYSVALGSALGLTGCNNVTLTQVGTINFGTSVSANNLSYFGTLLFVSGGLGGFKLVNVTLPVITTGLLTSL